MADTLIQYAMQVPDLKRRAVVEIFAAANPVLERLNVIDLGDAMGYEYSREASLPGIGVRAVNEEWPDQAEGANVPVREGTAIVGGLVKTDRVLAKNADRKAGRIAKKVKAASLYVMKLFFDGDQSSDPKQFDGLNRRLGTGGQTIKAGTNGAYLDLDNVQKLIDLVVGDDAQKALLMSKAMRRTLGATIRAAGGTVINMAEWSGPLNPTRFSNVEIVPIEKDHEDNEILGFDETCGSCTTAGSIYCVAFGASEDEDRLQAVGRNAAGGLFEVEEQGVRNTVDQVLVEGRIGLAMFHGRSAARYYGIKEGVSP